MNPANYTPPSPSGSFHDTWRKGPAVSLVGHFATPGTYTRTATGASLPLRGQWKAPHGVERLDGMGDPGLEGALPSLTFLTAELPAPAPQIGDRWSDGVTTWYVLERQPDPAKGTTKLILSLDPPV